MLHPGGAHQLREFGRRLPRAPAGSAEDSGPPKGVKMQYNYEVLTPDRFQELCQALIARTYKEAVSYPVGKRDGGRDALAPDDDGNVIVFQVKFRRTMEKPGDAAKLAISAFDDELEKLRRLKARGASRYILLTNLSATAGLDTGERDRVDSHLQQNSPVPAVVWWREDIDARLNDAYDVKWAFSEVITSADLLRKLLEEGFGESETRRDLAITNYLTSQYTVDEYVKFKQADLQASDLLALFIDVPASPQRSQFAKREHETRALIQGISHGLTGSHAVAHKTFASPREIALGAATLLLSPVGQAGLDSTVLEGGPGQGKSTLAQYVCQVHRMKILGKKDKLSRLLPDHRLAPVRVPFKVDLRDFANWLRRIDPFNGESPLANSVTPSLESFLAAQVKHLSGGQRFNVDDLRLFLRKVPALIVLDGLDEVAVVSDRRDVIEAVNGARARLEATAFSMQLIVTSRPAATASTPRFSGADWHFVDLQSITQELIFEYTDRWGTARKLDALDLDEIKTTLAAKLTSPHILDLARNAMQLTILLHLIHSRGAALPDQRTLLYDRYIDILFNREAGKNRVVRENRQLLIGLHGYVAWRMHSAAQSRRTNGRISEEELREMIGAYLDSLGHEGAVLDDLFSGVVQRIVALVSRVEGTFEFEVQPLREYFAGRHLYDTAPNSPVGNPQSGTKLEIFDALSSQPYWLNVTRFYAGCYSVGELAGLADQIQSVLDDERLGRTSFARVVATLLLADRVFQQSPKATASVVEKTADSLTMRYAFSRLFTRSEGPVIGMPGDCGRSDFLQVVVDRAVRHELAPIRQESAILAHESFPAETVFEAWLSMMPPGDSNDTQVEQWLTSGNALGVTSLLAGRVAEELAARNAKFERLLAEGAHPAVLQNPEIQRSLIDDALDGRRRGLGIAGALGWAIALLDARRPGWLLDPSLQGTESPWQGGPPVADSRVIQLVAELPELLRSRGTTVRGALEAARRTESIIGRRWLAWGLAIRALDENASATDLFVGAGEELHPSDIVAAVASARRRQAAPDWWRTHLSTAYDSTTTRALVAMCILWGSPSVLVGCWTELESRIDRMPADEYEGLLVFLMGMRNSSARRRLSTRVLAGLSRDSSSRRALIAVSQRGTEASRTSMIREATLAEVSADRILAEMLLDERVERIVDDRDAVGAVEDVLALFPRIGEIVSIGYGQRARGMREDVAVRVLAEPDLFPIRLLQAADVTLSTGTVGALSVAATARRQGWAAG